MHPKPYPQMENWALINLPIFYSTLHSEAIEGVMTSLDTWARTLLSSYTMKNQEIIFPPFWVLLSLFKNVKKRQWNPFVLEIRKLNVLRLKTKKKKNRTNKKEFLNLPQLQFNSIAFNWNWKDFESFSIVLLTKCNCSYLNDNIMRFEFHYKKEKNENKIKK